MSYELEFLPGALKEWQKLDNSIKVQFKRENNEVYEMLKDKFN